MHGFMKQTLLKKRTETPAMLHYLINTYGRVLFSEMISTVGDLIRWWTFINFLPKFQRVSLLQCGRKLIFAKYKWTHTVLGFMSGN